MHSTLPFAAILVTLLLLLFKHATLLVLTTKTFVAKRNTNYGVTYVRRSRTPATPKSSAIIFVPLFLHNPYLSRPFTHLAPLSLPLSSKLWTTSLLTLLRLVPLWPTLQH